MPSILDLLRNALVVPDYRDWSHSWEIIKARLKLLGILGLACAAGAFINFWLFVLTLPLLLGLAVAVWFDFFFAGSAEGVRRLRTQIRGVERVEEKRLEGLAKLDYNGFPVNPAFIDGLAKGLWLEVTVLERATGKRIAPSLAAELSQAKAVHKQRWIPTANVANVTRAVEPIGRQFFSIWLEKTAMPYWSELEREGRNVAARSET